MRLIMFRYFFNAVKEVDMKAIVIVFFIYLLETGVSSSLDKKWWKYTEIYDIEVGAYKDSDGDGFGDLEGLRSKLNYITELGFHVIKLSPIFSSGNGITLEYGIDDFTKIHITHGTMDDFEKLMEDANQKGIKVILDFPINHCSTSHEWFKKSQQKIYPYTDYFIWKDPYKGNKSRNTDLHFRYWRWDDTREEFYYYYFQRYSDIADLNLRNNAVKEEVEKVIKFWFDKGISGLNLLFANVYMEDSSIRDVDRVYEALISGLPESYDYVHELRESVDKYNNKNGGYERILMVAQNKNEKYTNLRGNETFPIAHIVLQNIFEEVFGYKPVKLFHFSNQEKNYFDSSRSLALIQVITSELKNGPTLFISEDVEYYVRLSSLFKDRQLLNTWIMFLFMCPASIHFYYGQEIGLDQSYTKHRSFAASYPWGSSMHWDDSINAGFTSSEFTMVPPNVDYWEVNVRKFKEKPRSIYHLVEELLQLRKNKVVQYGNLQTYNVTESVFAFSRSLLNEQTYLVVFNFANVINSISLHDISNDISDYVQVEVTTPNALNSKGEKIDTRIPLFLAPSSSIVLNIKNW